MSPAVHGPLLCSKASQNYLAGSFSECLFTIITKADLLPGVVRDFRNFYVRGPQYTGPPTPTASRTRLNAHPTSLSQLQHACLHAVMRARTPGLRLRPMDWSHTQNRIGTVTGFFVSRIVRGVVLPFTCFATTAPVCFRQVCSPGASRMFGTGGSSSDQQKPGGGSLFGTPAGQQTGRLFGSTATGGGGLFGGTQASSTGGLFGTSTSSQQPPTTSLFGTAPTQSTVGGATQPPATTTTGGGLFGASATPGAPTTSLFGAAKPSDQPTGGLFGGGASQPPAVGTAPTTSLFGGTTQPATGGGGLFGAPAPKQQATTGLFGTPTPATGGIFGTAAKPAQPAAAPAAGGLFGAPTAAATPGTTEPTAAGAAAAGTTPSLFVQPKVAAPTAPSLFGAAPTTAAPTTPTGGLFGAKPAETPAAGGGLFGTATAAPAAKTAEPASTGLFGKPGAESAAPTSLFGAAKPATPAGGLFGAKPAEAAPSLTGGLFGAAKLAEAAAAPTTTTMETAAAAAPSTAPSLFGAKPAEGAAAPSLFGAAKPAEAPATPSLFGAAGAGAPSLFGAKAPPPEKAPEAKEVGKPQKPAEPATPYLPVFGAPAKPSAAAPAEKPPALEVPKGLEGSYYERVDDLLRSWEQRTKRQVAAFGRFAEAVMTLDLDLCNSVATVQKLQHAQAAIENKQQEIDSSLDQIEKHQATLAETLQRLQCVLAPPSTGGAPGGEYEGSLADKLQSKLQALATNLDDSEAAINELIGDVNKVHDSLHPGTLGEVIGLLNMQQRSISRLYMEAQALRERLGQLDTRLH